MLAEVRIMAMDGIYLPQLDKTRPGYRTPEEFVDEMRMEGYHPYRLGLDELPEGVEDIRGRIADQPSHVYALVDDSNDQILYVGLVEFTD